MPKVQATNVNYELHSLGWKAFQNLCSTLTAEIWGQTVQGFFDSNDGGRDGAFWGSWQPSGAELMTGSFTVQCKFTATQKKVIKLSDIADELTKAERLAQKGLCDNYILMTNARLTGENEEIIRGAFLALEGINQFQAFGNDRICQIIQESPRLRMLVPRIYGLGDLSQILDERAYGQAQEILSSLGDDLSKFIITGAYRKSAEALVEHGFVFLLGEPMCGKSTIAAALAMGAIDEWDCPTIKVRDADDFVRHSNPNEKQFFWVDDAFGATQVDFQATADWNRTFPHVIAALKRGCKVLFTSRSYIFRAARRYLKLSAFPLLKESQVVIHVEDLSLSEREQILYNHVKLGNQATEFKKAIKSYLPELAAHEKFAPEIARRLGNTFFTKTLVLSDQGVREFVERPLDLLREIMETMDEGNVAALALVFMRGGVLPSPVEVSLTEKSALARLGGTEKSILAGLQSLDQGLLISVLHDGCPEWRFKHPTVRDAFAAFVAGNQDLMDIYLAGANLGELLTEITCGNVGVEGAQLIVPAGQYDLVIERLGQLNRGDWRQNSLLCGFLSHRCDKFFLERVTELWPSFLASLPVYSYFYACPEIDVLARFHQVELLPEDIRQEVFKTINDLAVSTPDAGYLASNVRSLLSDEEFEDIRDAVRNILLPNLSSVVDEWRFSYSPGDNDPDAHFQELCSALEDFEAEYGDDEEAQDLILAAQSEISEAIDYLREHDYEEPFDAKGHGFTSSSSIAQDTSRSIFDDVDM